MALLVLALLSLLAAAEARCSGFGLSGEDWDYISYLQEVAASSPLPREAKAVLFGFFLELEGKGRLPEVAENCKGEAVTLLAQSLTFLEQQRGTDAALRIASEAEKIAAEGPEALQLSFSAALQSLERGGAAAESCQLPAAPRVFVYDSGKLASRPLHCSAGMEGVEVLFHRFFLRSACLTREPEGADYFFVPFYSFCYQNEHLTTGNETAELDELHLNLVRGLEHFRGAARERHIFLFPHEFWDFPSWRSLVSQAHLLVVEANPLEWVRNEAHHCLDCFSADKDVVLPGHTDYWTTRQLLALQRPWLQRRYSVCYHGAFAHKLYDETLADAPYNTTAGMTRAALLSLAGLGLPRISIGGHLRPVREYYERIADCQYCLVPKGVGFTNGRLMESFFSGCVPVILSDAMVLPFDQLLQWPSFSMKLPMPRNLPEAVAMVKYVQDLPSRVGQRMHEALGEQRCWFDYGPEARPNCSPYEGVLRLLAMQRRGKQPRRFWRPV